MMDSKRPSMLKRSLSKKKLSYNGKDDATAATSATAFSRGNSRRSLMSTIAKTASLGSSMSSITLDDCDETTCLSELESFCRDNDGYNHLSSEMIFRFAFFHNFDYESAKSDIVKMMGADDSNKYLDIRMDDDLVEQFESGLLFPLPKKLTLKKDNSRVIYMRPSQYQEDSPQSESMVIESLCYVLNDCSKSESQCRDGVAVVVNMNGWNQQNFNRALCARVMKVLQGGLVPTRVKSVLIVDAPKEFVSIWNSLRKSLLTTFSMNVHLIKASKLGAFLMEGYEEQMPNDFVGTWRCPYEIVEDYVDLKGYHDKMKHLRKK